MSNSRAIETATPAGAGATLAYTIATLVNDSAQHERMLASFEAAGFTDADCEFLHIDNTGPRQTGAYQGLNRMLAEARGRFVILCHQDVRLIDDGRAALDARLTELDRRDPRWALAGNAGGVRPGRLAMRITDPHGTDRRIGDLPARVASLDENFIVVRRDTRVGFSGDLDGFHLYGADICLIADLMGYRAYVIDFHLHHLSAGSKSPAFARSAAAFRAKWSRAMRPRLLQTTCTLLRLEGGVLGRLVAPWIERPLSAITRRSPGAGGWTGRRA